MSQSPDIIFFGGVFDPIHIGHIDAVRIVQAAFPEAKVVLVPSFVAPTANGEIKHVTTQFVDRVAMSVIAFDEWPTVHVSAIEEELGVPSYTHATLEALALENPGSSLAWMIGADQLENFLRWRQPKKILELASLIILPRPANTTLDILEMATNAAMSLGFSSAVDESKMRLDLDGAHSIYVLGKAPTSVSSTEIRKLAAVDLQKISDKVPSIIMDYIADIGLYQQESPADI
jgi:nicotinate-nucleotide adenylyltransferase